MPVSSRAAVGPVSAGIPGPFSDEIDRLQRFADFGEARRAITAWIGWYNAARPHQALGYRSPAEFRAQQAQQRGLTNGEHYNSTYSSSARDRPPLAPPGAEASGAGDPPRLGRSRLSPKSGS